MKKKTIITIAILIVLAAAALLWQFANPESLESIVSYEIPEGWSEGLTSYWHDDEKTVSEISYENGDGYMSVSIFSFRRRTPYGSWENAREYVESLNEAEMITVDGRDCYIGWRGMDDHEKVNRAAYIFDGDYVLEVYLANSDAVVTDEQMQDMQYLLDSIIFK